MKNVHRIFSVIVGLVMILSLFTSPAYNNQSSAHAQDEIPTDTVEPTLLPTEEPTLIPTTDIPTEEPTLVSTDAPMVEPTIIPTEPPVEEPTLAPTGESTEIPTEEITPVPTEMPEVVPLIGAESVDAIPGKYIVVYKSDPDVSYSMNEDKMRIQSAGGTITHIYKSALKGFSAELSDDMLKTLRQDPRIDYIEVDQKVTIKDDGGPVQAESIESNPPSWGLDRIDQRNLPLDQSYHYPSSAGAGVNVYVIDTGIRATHQEYAGRVISVYDFVDNDTDASDCNGHGTHVAGIIGGNTVGVAKGVTLYSIRVLGCDGSGYTSKVIAGIDWVAAYAIRPAVANMSLGGNASTAEDTAVKNAISKGITFSVVAGNDGYPACYFSPARVPAAITVGAVTSADSDTDFSNYGTCLDLYAPGVDIYSSGMTSDSSYETWVGTSMATAHVTGAAALYLAGNPSASPKTVADALIADSTKNVISFPYGQGGSPNRLLYVSNALKTASKLVSPKSGYLTNDTTPDFTWNRIYNSDTFNIQISTNSKFSSPMVNTSVDSPFYTPSMPLADGKWYWRVQAVNALGQVGKWSATNYFTIDTTPPLPPILVKPATGKTVTGTPTFSWKASKTAKYYQFGYGTPTDTEPTTYISSSLKKTSHKPPIMQVGLHTWFVRAVDAAGNWSNWSTSSLVTINPTIPVAPALVAPANKSTTTLTTFDMSWNAVAYGYTYEIQIDQVSKFTSPEYTYTSDVEALTKTVGPIIAGKWYWRARAVNINGAAGKWSASRYFTIYP